MATRKLRPRLSRLAAMGTVVLTSLLVAGCGGGSGSTTTAPTDPAQVKGELSIVVSSATGSDAGFKAVSDAFAAKYPDVTVNLQTIPNENYNQARTSRLTAGSVDIVIANPRELPSYVPQDNQGDDARLADAGGFVDLTEQSFMDKFTPSVLDQIKYKGHNYTVPTGLSYYSGLTYNKKIFADHNISIPTTWTEFLAVCDQLRAAGITPISIGGRDTAGIVMLSVVQSLYPTADDKEALAKGLYEYTTTLNEGKQVEVLQKVQQIYTYGQPNFAGSNYSQMTADFLNGQAAMISDGTWNVGSLTEAGGVDFGYFPLPASDNAADNKYLGGKVELSLAVPANAPNSAAALAWLDFFSNNYSLFNDRAGFAPAQQGVAGAEFYTEIAPYTEQFEPAWDTIWIANPKAGQDAALPFNWNAVTPMGTSDAQAAADAAQAAWIAGR